MKHFKILKARQRAERHNYPDNLALRVHRALSWLGKAENCDGDEDAQFIFLWIAFNAAYANDLNKDHRQREHQTLSLFFEKLCELDQNKLLEKTIWQEYPSAIRVLLDNRYVFQPFWDYQNGQIEEQHWLDEFKAAKNYAHKALSFNNTRQILDIIFNRIYTLRNQMLHGGATYNSKVNRDQMRDCCHLMSEIVPSLITIMMENPNTLWGEAYYPVVKA